MKRGSLLAGVLALFLLAAACAPNVDLSKALTLTDVLSGYYDEGVQDGKTRLPPSITFRLHNASDKTIGPVQTDRGLLAGRRGRRMEFRAPSGHRRRRPEARRHRPNRWSRAIRMPTRPKAAGRISSPTASIRMSRQGLRRPGRQHREARRVQTRPDHPAAPEMSGDPISLLLFQRRPRRDRLARPRP